MNNVMIKVKGPKDDAFVSCPETNKKLFIDIVEQFKNPETPFEYTVFEAGKMPLSELPANIQEKVKDVLKAFHNVSVVFEYNEFHVSTSICVRASYNWDHFVCGRYADTEVYTEEERRRNYIKCFG